MKDSSLIYLFCFNLEVNIRLSILGERDLGHALIAITLCMKDSALYIYKIGVRGM